MTGIEGHLTCVSARADLPIRSFIGLPVSVEMTTDRGRLHTINGIVTDVRTGQSDGSLTCYQLTIRDVLSVMERRTNSRLFRTKNLPDILAVLLQGWRQRSSALAGAFEFDLSGLQGERYRRVNSRGRSTSRTRTSSGGCCGATARLSSSRQARPASGRTATRTTRRFIRWSSPTIR